MNNSRISYEQVSTLANQLRTASQSMESVLNEVKVLLDRVGTDVWTGSAATLAKEKFNTLVAKFPEFSNATGQCCNHLLSVVENYKNTDTTVSNI